MSKPSTKASLQVWGRPDLVSERQDLRLFNVLFFPSGELLCLRMHCAVLIWPNSLNNDTVNAPR